ncbi:uncharacterized protein METZ01_LOCUS35324 [marine metagenome]|uniref:Uncharacterized protein n=1 Tax=marine metagenome TaxID=408172 RepID=A0A381QTM7_9ZZZZ
MERAAAYYTSLCSPTPKHVAIGRPALN